MLSYSTFASLPTHITKLLFWCIGFLQLTSLIYCNVIAINIGSSVKVALFDKSSRTFDIILNQESARKTPLCVGISNTGKEVLFGSPAKASVGWLWFLF